MEELKGTKLEELLELLGEDCKNDYVKAHTGNKAASVRVRKAMGSVKALAQELRKEMLSSRSKE